MWAWLGGGLESAAFRQLAAAQFLPSINLGMNYDTHTGVLQQSNGNILSVNRSAVYVGAGTNAIAAGSVNIPGVYFDTNVPQATFAYLASRQIVREREFDTIAIRNQVLLEVTMAYSELLHRRGSAGGPVPGARRGARDRAGSRSPMRTKGKGDPRTPIERRLNSRTARPTSSAG